MAWDMKEQSSQAFQTLAALKSYGLLEYEGSGPKRIAKLTALARKYLRAQQGSVKNDALKEAALTPKLLATYWESWGADRPPDPVCLDDLVLERRFTQSAAETFLRVYDETLAFAELGNDELPVEGEPAAITTDESAERGRYAGARIQHSNWMAPQPPVAPAEGQPQAYREREWLRGALGKDVSYRILVSGELGAAEIGKLIKLLTAQQEVLSDE